MGDNGHNECIQFEAVQDLKAQVNSLGRQIRSFEAMAPNLDGLLGELMELRGDLKEHGGKLESHGKIMAEACTKLGYVEKDVGELKVWQKDVLGEGNRRLSVRAGQRRTALYGFLGALLLAIVCTVAGRVSSHITWHSEVHNSAAK